MRRQASFKVFSLVFGLVYFLCFLFDIALFRYYPEMNVFHFVGQTDELGPVILWYGWLAAALATSWVAAVVIPVRWADRLPEQLSWIVPAIVMVVMLIYETRWFR